MVEQNVLTVEVPTVEAPAYTLLHFFNKIFFSSFDVMAKQTPYSYSAYAKEIIQNTHDFCKREKEDGLKISLNQVKERAPTATGSAKV